jgi:hypothetical protein
MLSYQTLFEVQNLNFHLMIIYMIQPNNIKIFMLIIFK